MAQGADIICFNEADSLDNKKLIHEVLQKLNGILKRKRKAICRKDFQI